MKFLELQNSILRCRYCKRFDIDPNPIIFGREDAKIVHISQAPSQNVHNTSKPFNDSSGKRLREQWYQIPDEVFYNPSNFYITAIAHCFPGKAKNGGDKKAPLHCARKWLWKELDLVKNELYIVLGKQAAEFFFPDSDYNELIFSDNKLNEKLAFVLPHPSAVNNKWFKDHPEFEISRISQIRERIHDVLK